MKINMDVFKKFIQQHYRYIRYYHTPTIFQMEATECGAAALGMILAHYKCFVSLEELRRECDVSRDGSKAINMLKAARHYGMEANAMKVDDIDSLAELPLPMILFWEFNHYVVLEFISNNYFYINDPAVGHRVINREEFDRSFTGVALVMEPTKLFQQQGEPFSIVSSIKHYVTNIKYVLLYIILLSTSLVIPGILIPGMSKVFIDNILVEQMHDWLRPLIFGLLLTALLRGLLTWLQQYFLLKLRLKLILSMSTRFVWHIFHLPMKFFEQRYVGDIQNRVAANDRIANLLSAELSSGMVGIFSMVFYAAIMFFISWRLTLIGIASVFLKAGLFILIARPLADLSRRFLKESGRLTGIEMNGLHTIESIQASSTQDEFFKRWAGSLTNVINSQQKLSIYRLWLTLLPELITGLTLVIILGLGSLQIITGSLTVGSLVAFQSLWMSFSQPINILLSLGVNLQQIQGDFANIQDVMQHPIDPRVHAVSDVPSHQGQGHLIIRDVSFGYSPLESPILQHFDLEAKPGSMIGVIGASGSGKSTLARLICGLYKPWSGQIVLDGQLLEQTSFAVTAHQLAAIDQDSFLFEGTIHDNLTLWNKKITDRQLQTAIHDACLEEVIASHGGLNRKVQEGAVNFSGGQRQQFEIARALLHQPQLLILDEATSALDTILEQRIYQNLKKRHCTLLIITHRLSGIRDCDEIIVMQAGKIIERGVHQALYQPGSIYSVLINLE